MSMAEIFPEQKSIQTPARWQIPHYKMQSITDDGAKSDMKQNQVFGIFASHPVSAREKYTPYYIKHIQINAPETFTLNHFTQFGIFCQTNCVNSIWFCTQNILHSFHTFAACFALRGIGRHSRAAKNVANASDNVTLLLLLAGGFDVALWCFKCALFYSLIFIESFQACKPIMQGKKHSKHYFWLIETDCLELSSIFIPQTTQFSPISF